jgi:hypothetical protein
MNDGQLGFALTPGPRVDQLNPEILEMASVTGSECRPPRGDDTCDLDVTKIHRLPDCPPLRGATCRFLGSLVVEGENSPLEILIEYATERILELPSAASRREQL